MVLTSLPMRLRLTLVAALLSAITAVGAAAQGRWSADPKSSLAWWQMNPHLNHLWATTCPEEPSWRPGEGRSAGWVIGQVFTPPNQGYAAVSDTTHVPLYPRRKARSVCAEAVTAQVLVPDTTTWQGVRGQVVVKANALVGGEERRDAYARSAILQVERYPEIKFTVDSLVNVTRQADTIRATAMGVFSLHGAAKPMNAAVRAWHEAGTLRVMGKFYVDALDLVPEYGISKFALGLGVGTKIWQQLYMGVDLVLRPDTTAGAP